MRIRVRVKPNPRAAGEKGSAFTRYSFSSRHVYKNQYYYSQTPPLFEHPTLPPSSPTLLRNIVFPPDHPLLQYLPYNIGNGNIVQRPRQGVRGGERHMKRPLPTLIDQDRGIGAIVSELRARRGCGVGIGF